jgi:hypothetical protein
MVIALTQVDSNGRIDGLSEKFYGYLHEGNLITAGHVVDNSGAIALAKPELKHKITKELCYPVFVSVPSKMSKRHATCTPIGSPSSKLLRLAE